ncbi:response regulator, partial [Aduncisulcus paluster]
MIAEDIYSNIEVLLGHLKAYEFEFFISENGQDALEKATVYRPDIILMDMQMPIMSGYEVTKKLKDDPDTRDMTIVAVTASVMKDDEMKIRDICDGYLRKPFIKSDLLFELSRHLKHDI